MALSTEHLRWYHVLLAAIIAALTPPSSPTQAGALGELIGAFIISLLVIAWIVQRRASKGGVDDPEAETGSA